ncbi:hypothetical protein PF005_g7077 [Phytophthora fragariae]|uniref:N-acetylglucosaminylphosphatidylinositol deacetylase n=1 Tax=Phytophthora fragariae TaxID=53985 RepID=A0A6A3YM02_9STRA|nr:hypothetical protein PF007_g24783 [Phytophthora fragariae]KAE9076061.1 hypothetical protein PF010_g24054 [Phytophthora fragariae]KAE9221500.1 hypothetical protein PF005_g7077 [Phytophthora fragariae]KAE9239142.1 hypothetical protein PF002_g10421 [Phytophthora fragariae]
MLSSRERLQERQGQTAAPRHEHLQQLVDEFQRSPDILRKEEVVANLANFTYDPINYASLCRLRIMDLFLDILDADQEDKSSATSHKEEEAKQQGYPATTALPRAPRKRQLVEFALGGICNCVPDPALQQQFIDGEGVDIIAPYVLHTLEQPTASELNVAVSALTIAYFLLDSSAFADITSQSESSSRNGQKPQDARAGRGRAADAAGRVQVPDDESLFFLPLVQSLQQPHGDKWRTHLLCLSRGDFDGVGDVRVKELKACAAYIGLSTDHVQTRDRRVSGHANHIATHFGVKRAVRELQEKCSAAAGDTDDSKKETKAVRGWALESTNILRKYAGLLDAPLSYWLSRRKEEENENEERQFVFVCRPQWNYNAMALHQSQFVWYRRLFVAFSRYTFINTFRPLLAVGSADLPAEQKKTQ